MAVSDTTPIRCAYSQDGKKYAVYKSVEAWSCYELKMNNLLLTNFLTKNNLINDFYDAMESDDYSDVIMLTLSSVEKSSESLYPKRECKCEKLSDKYRNNGNLAYKDQRAREALLAYNKALRYAPNKSRAMVLAYSNRSAVLFNKDLFPECLSDIETCFRLGCPPEIVDKLTNRKELAAAKLLSMNTKPEKFYKYFQIHKRNADVPCASADVEIVVNDGDAKITAANRIKVGTVLAAEAPFVGINIFQATYNIDTCRYCFNTSFNLIPCDSCCIVMFCSEKCKQQCQRDYHIVECQIMEVIQDLKMSPKPMLSMIAALKFVNMCGSWREAIEESRCMGSNRRRVSNASQMFDVGNKLSVLNIAEEKIFVHGAMYESTFVYAKIIESLDKLTSYFPQPAGERALAQRALARVMMYVTLFAKPTLVAFVDRAAKKNFGPQSYPNNALCSFIGKLQHSCTPNAIVSYVADKCVLVALTPIAKGTELTIAYAGHYMDEDRTNYEKNLESCTMYGFVCTCFACSNEWRKSPDTLDKAQSRTFDRYLAVDQPSIGTNPETLLEDFRKVCEILTCLSNAPFSRQYSYAYIDFRRLLMFACRFTIV